MLECRYVNNEAARPSAVEETLVKTEQQLYFSEVLLYFIVLYCTVLHCTVQDVLYCTVVSRMYCAAVLILNQRDCSMTSLLL